MRVRITGDQIDQLYQLVLCADGEEGAALLLCGQARVERDPWSSSSEEKLIAGTVVPIQDRAIHSSSATHVTINTEPFVRALKRAQAENSVLAFVHGHPGGTLAFSADDDDNERALLEIAKNRNGPSTSLLSIIITPDRQVRARYWKTRSEVVECDIIVEVGANFRLHHAKLESGSARASYDRQIRLFGKKFDRDLRELRVGVVGAGATGSAVCTLLARLGVGRLFLLDRDRIEHTNLHRVHGAKAADADARRYKVDVLQSYIESLALGTRVASIADWVGTPAARDGLKSCDIIFGCTDDHDGRLFLNRFSYFYAVPVFDLGVGIDQARTPNGAFASVQGRLTLIGPGHTCMLCRSLIDLRQANAEALERSKPDEYQRQLSEGYVVGGAEPNPAVVTFTTEVACMAVNELINRLTAFRGYEPGPTQWMRLFHTMTDRSQLAQSDQDCPLCGTSEYAGRGDMTPFLDRVG